MELKQQRRPSTITALRTRQYEKRQGPGLFPHAAGTFPQGLGRKKFDWIRREQGLKEVTESPVSRATEIRNLATRNLLGPRPFLQNTPHLFLPGRDVNQPCLTEGKTEAPTVK